MLKTLTENETKCSRTAWYGWECSTMINLHLVSNSPILGHWRCKGIGGEGLVLQKFVSFGVSHRTSIGRCGLCNVENIDRE